MCQLNLTPDQVLVESANGIAQVSQLLSYVAHETDFGGYAGPAGSLLLLGFLIVSLAQPLDEAQSA